MFVAAACGADDNEPVGGPPGTDAPPATPVVGTDEPAGGWIDGPPEWDAIGGLAEGGELRADTASSAEFSGDDAVSVDAAPIPVEPDGGIGDGAEPLPPDIEPPPVDQPLRAGSVDDNADYQGFLDYLSRIRRPRRQPPRARSEQSVDRDGDRCATGSRSPAPRWSRRSATSASCCARPPTGPLGSIPPSTGWTPRRVSPSASRAPTTPRPPPGRTPPRRSGRRRGGGTRAARRPVPARRHRLDGRRDRPPEDHDRLGRRAGSRRSTRLPTCGSR